MKNLMHGRAAIVTGAGQGIGFSICKALAESGAKIILNDLETGLAEEAAKEIRKSTGAECIPAGGDASDLSFISSLTSLCVESFGTVDIAVANAGITLFGDFFDYPQSDFERVMRTNLFGSFFLAQAAANVMKEHGRGGSIVFMSSVTAHQAHKNLAAYAMTKAALETLARTLVVDLSAYKITVNAIAPGATLNNRTMNDPKYSSTWARLTPLGKAASTEDVANAVRFLVSPQASHITGQTLIVDGGWSCTSPSPYEDNVKSSEH